MSDRKWDKFPIINKKETAVRLKFFMELNHLKPRDIQKYLGLTCVQTVYRWLDGINAVVFLLHKPVGLGKEQNMITTSHESFKRLIQLVHSGKTGYKIRFHLAQIVKSVLFVWADVQSVQKLYFATEKRSHVLFFMITWCK